MIVRKPIIGDIVLYISWAKGNPITEVRADPAIITRVLPTECCFTVFSPNHEEPRLGHGAYSALPKTYHWCWPEVQNEHPEWFI